VRVQAAVIVGPRLKRSPARLAEPGAQPSLTGSFVRTCSRRSRGMPPAKVKHKLKDDKAAYKVPSLYDSAFFLGTQYGDENAWLEQEHPGEEAVSDTLPAAGDFTEEVRRPPRCLKGRHAGDDQTCGWPVRCGWERVSRTDMPAIAAGHTHGTAGEGLPADGQERGGHRRRGRGSGDRACAPG
jgi:hypothetical protein